MSPQLEDIVRKVRSDEETTRMVSATLSPLDALETVSLGKPRTCPPRFSIAASNERRVRVDGS